MIKWDVLVSPFLLPVSFLWDAFCFWRLWINYWLSQPGKEHLTKVSRVQAQVSYIYILLSDFRGGGESYTN